MVYDSQVLALSGNVNTVAGEQMGVSLSFYE
jgi:hypothetical protein